MSELSLLQVSLFKISSEATNITSFAISCNRSLNFNSLHPHTDYMLVICFSDLQCINTTFVTGNGKIITFIYELTHAFIVGVMSPSLPLLVTGLLSVLILSMLTVILLFTIILYYSFYYKRKAEQKLNDNITQNVAYLTVHQQTTTQTEEDYSTIPDIDFPINNDPNYKDIIAGEHTYINTSTIPLENTYENIISEPHKNV